MVHGNKLTSWLFANFFMFFFFPQSTVVSQVRDDTISKLLLLLLTLFYWLFVFGKIYTSEVRRETKWEIPTMLVLHWLFAIFFMISLKARLCRKFMMTLFRSSYYYCWLCYCYADCVGKDLHVRIYKSNEIGDSYFVGVISTSDSFYLFFRYSNCFWFIH